MITLKNLQWSDGDIDMLGARIKNNIVQDNSQLEHTIVKMENVANIWSHRRLTLTGKVLLVNMLMSSLFIY